MVEKTGKPTAQDFNGNATTDNTVKWKELKTCINRGCPKANLLSSLKTSVVRHMRKVKPRWRPLTSNSSEGRKQLSYHFPQLNRTVSLIKFSVPKIILEYSNRCQKTATYSVVQHFIVNFEIKGY
jgi:hypothetical protein